MYTAEEIYDLGVNRNLSKAKAKMLAEAYSCGIEGEYKHLSAADSFGIYGIYKNGSLLYVGMTMRDFELR